jgi:magnesium chelatase family protein
MGPREIRELIKMDQESQDFMRMVSSRMGLSARVFDRLLKVARTIADLARSDDVRKDHLAEAVQYRDRAEF